MELIKKHGAALLISVILVVVFGAILQTVFDEPAFTWPVLTVATAAGLVAYSRSAKPKN